jgi:5-methylcytosine-specific restriction endonuclease McrA
MGNPGKNDRINRVYSLELVRKMKTMPCHVCDAKPPNFIDYLRPRSNGGGDEMTNVWALCGNCRRMRKQMGLKAFAERFSVLLQWERGHPKLII